MAEKKCGERTLKFASPVYICGIGSVCGSEEAKGPLHNYFDMCAPDGLWGEKTFEKAEKKYYETAVSLALQDCGKKAGDMDFLIGGDLLNQIISASFAARELQIPYFGIYGACSAMSESLALGSTLIDGGFADHVLCATSSHFATAERQFRNPLELGTPQTPTSQNTVTAAGATVLSRERTDVAITACTIGRVVDMGITDANDMGSAMVAAAVETVVTHLEDTGQKPTDFDLIVTGDLGKFGAEMFLDLSRRLGYDMTNVYKDCGVMIYGGMDGKKCGGSGCGCGASVLNGFLLKSMRQKNIRRILFTATGALLSPTSVMQGESIPGVAHAISIERR